MQERKFGEQDNIASGGKALFLSAAATIEPYQQVVRVTANAGTGAYAVTLPLVSRVPGRFFSILALDADGTNAVTIQDQDESEDWADKTLQAINDGYTLYSDGRKWWVAQEDVAATASPTTLAPTTLAPTTLAPTTL